MQTNFTLAQLADPAIQEADKILRACVHCGFCTATCPTYVLLGDELDSPRGRIYQIKDTLEKGQAASPQLVKHIDRCLSCLSCMTTCPSGVHYMHLVDHARKHIEETHQRAFLDKALRDLLAFLLPRPGLFRFALLGALLLKPIGKHLPGRLGALFGLAPKDLQPPSRIDLPQTVAAQSSKKGRVAILTGCAQQVLEPEINESTVRLLTRAGLEVVVPENLGCCGALVLHMGREEAALEAAKGNIDAWLACGDLDAVVINASGCGTTIKDYGHMLREDPEYAEKAAKISAMAKDVSEVLTEFGLPDQKRTTGQRVTYHSACSMQHGQKLKTQPQALLKSVGFVVSEPRESHLCCGSAGTYNLLQPEIAGRLRDRKVANLEATTPEVIAAGNIGCITQIATGSQVPIVHSVTLLDWATGGPLPRALKEQAGFEEAQVGQGPTHSGADLAAE